jgi:hypothetical protein
MKENMFDGLNSEEEARVLVDLLQEVLDQNWNEGMRCLPDIRAVLAAWHDKYYPETIVAK